MLLIKLFLFFLVMLRHALIRWLLVILLLCRILWIDDRHVGIRGKNSGLGWTALVTFQGLLGLAFWIDVMGLKLMGRSYYDVELFFVLVVIALMLVSRIENHFLGVWPFAGVLMHDQILGLWLSHTGILLKFQTCAWRLVSWNRSNLLFRMLRISTVLQIWW